MLPFGGGEQELSHAVVGIIVGRVPVKIGKQNPCLHRGLYGGVSTNSFPILTDNPKYEKPRNTFSEKVLVAVRCFSLCYVNYC